MHKCCHNHENFLLNGENRVDIPLKLTPISATNIKVSFKSNKASVVSIDKAGRLTAKKKGNVTITVKAGGKTVKKKITVR